MEVGAMLPQVQRHFLRAWVATMVAVTATLAGCGREESPETQVRAVIAAGEAAAEERDLAGILEHVSPAFRDERGGGPEELKQYLRGYFVLHQSVHLLTRVESVEFPYRDYARVQLKVGMLGREAAGATTLDLAADVQEIVLELALEDDEWRVVRAAWRSARGG
jgi:hypothetical protein